MMVAPVHVGLTLANESFPVPCLIKLDPANPVIVPLNNVLLLLPPAVRLEMPKYNAPLPANDPIVSAPNAPLISSTPDVLIVTGAAGPNWFAE